MNEINVQELEKRGGHVSVMNLVWMSSIQDPEMHMVSAKPVYVSPEDAKELLGSMVKNRAIRPGHEKRYQNHLLEGSFNHCVSPLVVTTEQQLCDGQHRLQAIAKTGKGEWFFIVVNFPVEAMINVDTGSRRTEADNMRISGDIEDCVPKAVVSMVNAYARETVPSYGDSAVTGNKKSAFINRYQGNLLTAFYVSGVGASTPLCRKSGVQAAIFAALCAGIDKSILERFCRCVNTGTSGEDESAAIRLRDYLMQTKGKSSVLNSQMMRITENAIKDFVAGQKRVKAYSASSKHVYIGLKGMPTFD